MYNVFKLTIDGSCWEAAPVFFDFVGIYEIALFDQFPTQEYTK